MPCRAPGRRKHAPAFAAALAEGVDGIELDVHRTTDEQLVVIHDFVVDGTTNGSGPVAAMKRGRSSIASMPAAISVLPTQGRRCRAWRKCLTLSAATAAASTSDQEHGPYANDASDLVAALIRQRNLYDQVIVSSFNPITLIKLRHLDPKIALGMLYGDEMPQFLRETWAGAPIRPGAASHHALIDAGYMAWARPRYPRQHVDRQRSRRGAAAGRARRPT